VIVDVVVVVVVGDVNGDVVGDVVGDDTRATETVRLGVRRPRRDALAR